MGTPSQTCQVCGNHEMIPGTHEWPRTPQCRCGADWDRWNDRCCRNEQANERIGGTNE